MSTPIEEIQSLLDQLKVNSGKSTDSKSIVIQSEVRQRLEKLFGKNMTTEDDVLRNVEHALEFEINGMKISLTPYLMDRLKTRCIGMSFDQFLPWIIKQQLEIYAGIR